MIADRGRAAPTISVLMPAYNPGRFLEAAIRSAVEQLGAEDELVVQDANSDDGSAEVFAAWAAADPRVRVVHEKDCGQSDALNRCLARARGQWCVWLNADDVLVDGALDAVRTAIAHGEDLDLVVGANQILRAEGDVVDDYSGHALTRAHLVGKGCAAFSGSIAMRTGFLQEVGGFDARLNTMMDLELQLRMAEARPNQVVLEQVIGALRFHEVSKSANLWREFVAESHEVRMAHADTPALKATALLCTGMHLAAVPIFRLRLSPMYRAVRKSVVRR
ncbi:glycosyltransferase [Tsukamurella asaccharolytica]|uniref:Glycosyltransferase n=1 Tax=Tsukamurella asaccharolytica TaxID=2592067 RepID=A0A5C5R6G5_9ACTN|nr:glycosyltransferase [Tsukamurella asaccharolytica]TWS17964.1 glycosyltransferase [Tsukamurella asaccharolytica]